MGAGREGANGGRPGYPGGPALFSLPGFVETTIAFDAVTKPVRGESARAANGISILFFIILR